MVLNNVYDFQTGENIGDVEQWDIHQTAQQMLAVIDKHFDLPNIVLASTLMLLAHELIGYEKRYLSNDMNFVELAKMISQAYD